jgi:hypothetical protein
VPLRGEPPTPVDQGVVSDSDALTLAAICAHCEVQVHWASSLGRRIEIVSKAHRQAHRDPAIDLAIDRIISTAVSSLSRPTWSRATAACIFIP